MKRNNKKGFTIVELVIVIAVIAILSAVLIPTFGGIVEKANESARDQEAANIYKNYLIDHDYVNVPLDTLEGKIYVDGYEYTVTKGQLDTEPKQQKVNSIPEIHLGCDDKDCDHACAHVDLLPEGDVDGKCDKCEVPMPTTQP